jgi:ribonuclease Z
VNLTFLGISGGLQSPESGNVSFFVTENKTSIIVEVSGNPAGELTACGVDPAELDAVFLSHAHVDHIYALPSLLHNMWLLKRSKPLPIFANVPTFETARTLCDVFGIEKKPGMFRVEWTVLPKQAMELGPFILETFPTVHGVPTLGFVLSAGGKKMAYFADTAPLTDDPTSAIGANAVIHEAGGIEAEESTLNLQGHCSGRQAAVAAGKISLTDQDPPTLFLCHLPPEPEKRTAIFSEARFHHPGRTMIPNLVSPYTI